MVDSLNNETTDGTKHWDNDEIDNKGIDIPQSCMHATLRKL